MALNQAALADLRITLIPEMFVKNEIESGELVKLIPLWAVESLHTYALYPYHKEQSYKLHKFIDIEHILICELLMRFDHHKISLPFPLAVLMT